MPAGWISAAIGAAGAIGGALISSSGAEDAAETQAAASDAAIREQQRQFNLTREDYAPYREEGVNALRKVAGEIDTPTTAAEAMSDPGYQFGLQQGQQAIDRKIAASGGRVSGRAIKAAARFGTDYATTGYGAAYQRRQDRLNRLAALAGIGQTATAGSAAAGAAASGNISGIIQSQGDAAAAGGLARGNIWGNAMNELASIYKKPSSWPGSGSQGTDRSSFRSDDPYRDTFYYGGGEGE